MLNETDNTLHSCNKSVVETFFVAKSWRPKKKKNIGVWLSQQKKRISIKSFNHIHYQIAKQDITADVCYVAHGTQNL